ncbi:MAG: cell envelope integrity protein TolA [Alphaproteobacteria bacterium]|nr:cell envelope integrity protein TolA [Alphaproteobacteria bacterium]
MKNALKKSIALHLLAFLLIVVDLPLFWRNKITMDQVPIVVDLKDVKISEVTNLPPKARLGDEDKEAARVKPKKEKPNYDKDVAEEEVKPVEKQDKPQEQKAEKADVEPEPKKDYLAAPKPQKTKTEVKKKPAKKIMPPKSKPKHKIEKSKPKEDKKSPELANPLKSLLASVNQMEKNIGTQDTEATIKTGTKVENMGVEGGTKGSYFSELSISEIDAIAGRLRACWNLDPGAMGIENMIVEIRASLNQDGSVRKVDILDTSRYNSDNHFRSVADSARRAVHICGPYKIFAERYADKYDKWNTLLLRFNPLNMQIN